MAESHFVPAPRDLPADGPLMGERNSEERLRDEFLKETQGGANPQSNQKSDGKAEPDGSASPGAARQGGVLSPKEQRLSEETQLFRERYHKQNLDLDPIQPGWGPFQVLEQMVKDRKIDMDREQMLEEAKRIRDRDFKDLGRDYYTTRDHIKLWSDREIDARVLETVGRIKGIDVSAHQGKIDWKKVKDAGYEFAFLKATEGGDWVDSTFATNRKEAREAGLAVGYYHYFRPPRPVEDQIANFVKTVGKVEGDALRLVIDTEDEKMWKPYNIEQRIKMIEDWCKGVQKELGVTPQITIYGSPNFFRDVLQNSPQLAKYSLWIANYNVAEPIVPKLWTKWDFWQYTEKGKVPGIASDGVDINMFHGNDLSKIPGFKKP